MPFIKAGNIAAFDVRLRLPILLRRLTTTLALALIGLLSLPGVAAAEVYAVDTVEDVQDGDGCFEEEACSLRGAILRANSNQEDDAIFFSDLEEGSVLEIDSPLPPITDSVTIDGRDEGGQPGIAIVGDSAGDPGSYGLEVLNTFNVEIQGLAIGGFGVGIAVTGESSGVRPCANRIGTDLSGEAVPNGVGILVGSGTSRVVVSNQQYCDANVISHNLNQGILIENGDRRTDAYGNSIFANGELGIEIETNAPQPPSISSVVPDELSTTVSGALSGAEPLTSYYVDFYANESCDPSGAGEGQTYLGSSESTLETDGDGAVEFTAADLSPLPEGQDVITATASEEVPDVGGQVSEFSTCFDLSPDPPPPVGPFDPPAPFGPLLAPENGETLLVAPVKGAVFVKLPGGKKFVRLREGQLIPVGAIVDATRGKVTLTSIDKAGVTQTAVFYGGRFLVAQREGSGLVTLRLRGALNCKSGKKGKPKAKGSEALASAKRKGRRLWGSGKGRFRTQGNYGSATVRGTDWLTEDRCAGTFFKVRKGSVTVRDFSLSKTLNLNRGKSYLAKP